MRDRRERECKTSKEIGSQRQSEKEKERHKEKCVCVRERRE